MTVCTWLGIDMARHNLLGQLPTTSAQLERQVSARESSVELINREGCFDESHTASLLHGVAWRGSPIDIRDDRGVIVSGRVIDGVADTTHIKLDVRSHFAGLFGSLVTCVVRAEDPATALLRVLQSAGTPEYVIDVLSFQRARAHYQMMGARVSVTCTSQYEARLIDAVNAIVDMGCLYVWMDDRIHITLLPPKPPEGTRYLQHIRHEDILGAIQYSNNRAERVTGYSLGYMGDSNGNCPAEYGVLQGMDASPWSSSYGGNNQYQIIDYQSAHALGRLRMSQGQPRRAASLEVRDNGSIPINMAGLYYIDDAPWGGNPACLIGYTRSSTLHLNFLEVL